MGTYGSSEARGHINHGDGEAALLAADADITQRPNAADAHFDRACALELVEDFSASLDAFERAIALNLKERMVDSATLDDTYFSALVSASSAASNKTDAAALFERYARTLPEGAHGEDAKTWRLRALGLLESTLDKTTALG
jgi:tetratricopeptide (TPR) repeat protein